MSGHAAAWAQLLRISALFTVPGDTVAGAVAAGRRPGRGTLLAAGSSLCLYEAGMALNDWADRAEDAVERPERPLPAGRIRPAAALAAATGLTAAGLALAARAGRPPLATAGALAATVWAYDLRLKHTPAGPAAMATARALDILLGATASIPPAAATRTGTRSGPPTDTSPAPVTRTGPAPAARTGTGTGIGPGTGTGTGTGIGIGPGTGTGIGIGTGTWTLSPLAPGTWTGIGARTGTRTRAGTWTGAGTRAGAGTRFRSTPPGRALSAAAFMGAHTLAVTAVSRREAQGGAPAVPLAALGAVTAIAAGVASHRGRSTPMTLAATAAYLGTAVRPLAHAALNPSPRLLQRAVGGGIRAMIPLQAALTARADAAPVIPPPPVPPGTAPPGGGPSRRMTGDGRGAGYASALLALIPLARRLSRKVSPT